MPYSDPIKRREYHRAYNLTYVRLASPEKKALIRAQNRAWHHVNKTRRNKEHRERIRALRLEVLGAYGGFMCACCGELEVQFLCLDHINNDGAEERRIYGQDGTPLWRRLKRLNWPPGYQVLCYNCNNGKRVNSGICPHQEARDAMGG